MGLFRDNFLDLDSYYGLNFINTMFQMRKIIGFIVFLCVVAANQVSAQCISGNCYEGRGTFRFENGDEYDGLWLNGQPDGQGKYTWKNGDFYRGNWIAGKMDGRGFYKYANGDKYTGEFRDNKMDGRGHFYWDNPGDVMNNAKYEGYWQDGKPMQIEVQPTGEPMDSNQKKR